MATTDTPDVPTQQRHLHEAKQAVSRGHSQYARRVIFAWHARLGVGPPFQVNQREDTEIQTSFCADCSTGEESVEAEFFWVGWGSLCSWCTLSRFDNNGRNTRAVANDDRQNDRGRDRTRTRNQNQNRNQKQKRRRSDS